VNRSRPILIIDTSVFVSDAFSKTGTGASSRLLAVAPAIAHLVMCDEIRSEILRTFDEVVRWNRAQVLARYGPVLEAARWIEPVAEQEHHLKIVGKDPKDTVFVRLAEAVYTQATDLLGPEQLRFVVTENTRHFPQGADYAGFRFDTPRGVLSALV
jgi:predicted nucleic acid-binding protein